MHDLVIRNGRVVDGRGAARRPGIATGAVADAFFEPLPEKGLNAWA